MVELLVVTSHWPFGLVPEFMDREIHHLADAFDHVRVAPMRLKGALNVELPFNVTIDSTLAQSLSPASGRHLTKSRQGVAARNLMRRYPGRAGKDEGRVRDCAHPSWVAQALLARADRQAVYRWARNVATPSVAYTFWLSSATEGLRAAWPMTPLVSRAHGGDVYGYAHGWDSIPYQGSRVHAADKVACVSSDAEAYLSARYPMQHEKIVVRRLGVADLGGIAHRDLGPTIRVLSVSSINSTKRVDSILSALRQLTRMGHTVDWDHFGDGPQRHLIEAGLRNSPSLLRAKLHGHVDLSTVHRGMIAGGHHVFVNFSRSEGVPVSIIEAQCVGLPVVATDVGGSTEAAPRHLNEFVSVGASPQDAADAILRALARNPNEAHARRTHWAENFDSESVYPAFANELLIMAGDGRDSRS